MKAALMNSSKHDARRTARKKPSPRKPVKGALGADWKPATPTTIRGRPDLERAVNEGIHPDPWAGFVELDRD